MAYRTFRASVAADQAPQGFARLTADEIASRYWDLATKHDDREVVIQG